MDNKPYLITILEFILFIFIYNITLVLINNIYYNIKNIYFYSIHCLAKKYDLSLQNNKKIAIYYNIL